MRRNIRGTSEHVLVRLERLVRLNAMGEKTANICQILEFKNRNLMYEFVKRHQEDYEKIKERVVRELADKMTPLDSKQQERVEHKFRVARETACDRLIDIANNPEKYKADVVVRACKEILDREPDRTAIKPRQGVTTIRQKEVQPHDLNSAIKASENLLEQMNKGKVQ